MKKIFLAMAIAIVTGTAVSAQDDDKEDKIVVSTHQTDKEDGYEGHSASRCGIKFNFQLIGVTKVELESIDGYPLAGTATTQRTAQGKTVKDDMVHKSTKQVWIYTRKRLLHFHLTLQPLRRIQALYLPRRTRGALFRCASEGGIGRIYQSR